MGIDSLSASFAADYGLRDALILSEICAVVQYGGDGEEGVSGPELGCRFPYLTKEQIREALQSLKQKRAITGRRIQGKFTREIQYVPSGGISQKYLQDVMESRPSPAARLPCKKCRPLVEAAKSRNKGGGIKLGNHPSV
jgi:hypothetical protein